MPRKTVDSLRFEEYEGDGTVVPSPVTVRGITQGGRVEKESVVDLTAAGFFSRKMENIRNWHDFLKIWAKTRTIEELLGLLHWGFTMPLGRVAPNEPEYRSVDRIRFYLEVADGWRGSVARCAGKPSEVAEKAFSMLCGNVFKTRLREDGYFLSVWESEFTSEKLFPAIQKFFRVESSSLVPPSICNLSRGSRPSHNEEAAREFLCNLASFLWGWREVEVHTWTSQPDQVSARNEVIRARLDQAKPWMIEVLNYLDRLDLLDPLELEENSVAKLTEIALRSELRQGYGFVREDRKVRTIEEACFVGSKVAWLLKRREILLAEKARLERLYAAEVEAAEAAARLARLRGSH